MKRILAALGVAGLAGLSVTAPAAANDNANNDHQITICHATGSATNPYVSVTMDVHALNAHMGHQHEEDIIPANDGKVLPGGQNLDKAGIWNAGCSGSDGPGNGNGNDGHKITICHATGSEKNPYVVVTIDLHGLNGHANANHQLTEDIIPPNSGKVLPGGQNWTNAGKAIHNNGCEGAVVPPGVTPPGVTPPGVTPPGVTPPAATPVVPGAVTRAPSGAVAGAVGAVAANNPGFNVQTAVAASDNALAPWVAGLMVMLLAVAGVAARRVLPVPANATSRDCKD